MSQILAATLLALTSIAGCTDPDAAGPFEFEEGEDPNDPVSAAAGKADSTKSCTAKTVSLRALGGTVLTPTGPQKGYVVIQDEKIVSVQTSKAKVPAGAVIIETGGVISPGLIDLHNHVAYNFLPLWNSGKKWLNRYQWARAKAYSDIVKTPYNDVKNAGNQCEGLKYGEYRALVGGTTSIQGSVDLACSRGWVRNVEFVNFCQDKVRQNVLAISSISPADAATLNAQFTSGQTVAFLVHLAEGIDDSSRAEFEQLRGLGLLKPQVVGIHSTALNPAQLQEMGTIGMKIVWSPLSNLILYGKTTDIPTALKAGIKVALAADWSPSGSANLLGELKVADRVNKTQFGSLLSDQQLWQMATETPAEIIGMSDKIGRIAPGYYADLVVIAGDVKNPYRAVIDATPEDVLMTMISGAAEFGATAWLDQLGQAGKYELVDACGMQRGIVVQDPTVKPDGTESLAQIEQIFSTDKVSSVIPLFQCTPAPEWAFQ